MTEGGFYQPARARKTSIAIVVLIHGAALTVVALSKMEIRYVPPTRTVVTWVDPIKPPPEQTKKVEPMRHPTQTMPTRPTVEPPIIWDIPTGPTFPPNSGDLSLGDGDSFVDVTPPPPPVPVRKEARIDSQSELQPPYPASEQRMGAEGLVSIRVLIGSDGRVKEAEKVKATSEAFYQATLRHALRNWRFTPATVDGRPVESRKLMVVRFEMNG